jgi:hypothetical protein
MKLSDARPCDSCHGPIPPLFYIVRISAALFEPKSTNQVFRGKAAYQSPRTDKNYVLPIVLAYAKRFALY